MRGRPIISKNMGGSQQFAEKTISTTMFSALGLGLISMFLCRRHPAVVIDKSAYSTGKRKDFVNEPNFLEVLMLIRRRDSQDQGQHRGLKKG